MLDLGFSHTKEEDQDEVFIRFLLSRTAGEGRGKADTPVTISLTTQPRTERAGEL